WQEKAGCKSERRARVNCFNCRNAWAHLDQIVFRPEPARDKNRREVSQSRTLTTFLYQFCGRRNLRNRTFRCSRKKAITPSVTWIISGTIRGTGRMGWGRMNTNKLGPTKAISHVASHDRRKCNELSDK